MDKLHSTLDLDTAGKLPKEQPISKEPLLSFADFCKELEEKEFSLEKKKTKGLIELANPLAQMPMNPTPYTSISLSSASPSSQLTPEGIALFEAIGKACYTLHESGDSHTTFYLGEGFSSNLFQGAKITISEYSTAPKSFNIQIQASSSAVVLVQMQVGSWLQFLQNRRLPFKINRVDTSLFSSREEGAFIEPTLPAKKDESV